MACFLLVAESEFNMQLGFLAIDQYGQHYKIEKHPRKELLEQLGASNASKMYVDTKDGKQKHVGYVVAGLWLNVYTVHEWKEAQA